MLEQNLMRDLARRGALARLQEILEEARIIQREFTDLPIDITAFGHVGAANNEFGPAPDKRSYKRREQAHRNGGATANDAPPRKRRKMKLSKAGREAIAAAQRARWAEKRAMK